MKDSREGENVAQRGSQTAERPYWTDAEHPTTREAMSRPCPICYVKPRRVCVDPYGAGLPLPDRVIHLARSRPDLKPKRSKQ